MVPVILSRLHMLENRFIGIDLHVTELQGRKYTILRYSSNAPVVLRNRTGQIEVRMEGNRLVIDDGYKRKPRGKLG